MYRRYTEAAPSNIPPERKEQHSSLREPGDGRGQSQRTIQSQRAAAELVH